MIKTVLLDVNPNNKIKQKNALETAAELLKSNEVVAFPTETVYGLGANAFSDEAVSKVFTAKNRPSDNPLIVHASNVEHCEAIIKKKISGTALILAKKFWPGPLSIIFFDEDQNQEKGAFGLSKLVTCSLNSAAFRIPSKKSARELIALSGLPIAAPSANSSGRPSPTKAQHVYKDLNGKIKLILDGGDCDVGLESTVVSIKPQGVVTILREGKVTLEMLQEAIPNGKIISNSPFKNEKAPICPGLKYRHYAPETDMVLVNGSTPFFIRCVVEKIKENGKIGVLCSAELKKAILEKSEIPEAEICFSVLGLRSDLKSIGRGLYSSLHYLDAIKLPLILAESFDREDFGCAIMNRLEKASGYNILKE